MSKKQTLHDALHNSSMQQNASEEADIQAKEMKKMIVEISEEAHLQIDQMKRDLRRGSMRNVVREALNDLFRKYDYPPIA